MSEQRSSKGPGASVSSINQLRNDNNQLEEMLLSDGGEEPEDKEPIEDTKSDITEEEQEAETDTETGEELPQNGNDNENNRGIRSKFRDFLGIGEDHTLPEEVAQKSRYGQTDSLTSRELAKQTETFENNVSNYDTKRTEFEADIQAQIQANETVISEEVKRIAEQLTYAEDLASRDLEHTYDFDPEQGDQSLGFSLHDIIGQETDIPEEQYDFDISDEGLASYLAKVSEMGDDAMQNFSDIQKDMKILNDRRETKRQELEELRSRNEDQLDSSRSRFTTENEKNRAEEVKGSEDVADQAEFEREVSEIDQVLSRKRPRKEQHLSLGNALLDEARSEYESHASDVQEEVSNISQELDYLTDALENLTRANIGEMDELLSDYLEDHDNPFEGSGKHHSDAEGMLRNQHIQVVSALGVKIAQQYAQGQKAVEELGYLEDVIGERTDRIEAERSVTVQETLDQSYDGEGFEEYLEDQMSQVLGSDYSARDDIRNVFKGLEGMRDNRNKEE